MKRRDRPVRRPAAGFTIIEAMLTLFLILVLIVGGASGFRAYGEATALDRAANVVRGDIALARSHAIQRGEAVAFVAEEAELRYGLVELSTGTVLDRRSFGEGSDLTLTLLNVRTDGDAIAFNARGLLVGGGTVAVDLERRDGRKRIVVTVAGRTHVVSP